MVGAGRRHRRRGLGAAPSLDERITTALAEAQEALPFADLRAKCRVRAATLHERIGLLATAGRIVKTGSPSADQRSLPSSRSRPLYSVWEWERELERLSSCPPQPSLVRPQRSFLHPGRSKPTRARAAAVKTGRRSLGATRSDAGRPRLDGREHGSTLHRLGAKPGRLNTAHQTT